MQKGQKICHGLGFWLEAGHGWGATAHHLLNQLAVIFAMHHAVQIGAHQPLGGQPMAAGAVEAKQATAVLHRALSLQGGAGVGIGVQGWKHQHQGQYQAGQTSQGCEGSHEATAALDG